MTMKKDVKFKEDLSFQFKIDMRNLANFDASTQKSQKTLYFNGLLLTKEYSFWAKEIIEELYLMELKIDAKFEGKLATIF